MTNMGNIFNTDASNHCLPVSVQNRLSSLLLCQNSFGEVMLIVIENNVKRCLHLVIEKIFSDNM